jgi:hypothetical protein
MLPQVTGLVRKRRCRISGAVWGQDSRFCWDIRSYDGVICVRLNVAKLCQELCLLFGERYVLPGRRAAAAGSKRIPDEISVALSVFSHAFSLGRY